MKFVKRILSNKDENNTILNRLKIYKKIKEI